MTKATTMHGHELQLRSHEYVVLDSADFLKRSARRTYAGWTDSDRASGFAFEVVRAFQCSIRSYSDYQILQQWA
jgi:hypothetical protein